VTFLVAIAGLLALVFLHELGHFLTALAVRMRPRKFYVGFPPALAKTRRGGVEYGVGVIPLGGYVKIPGMFRPAAGDLDRWFSRAQDEDRSLRRRLEPVAAALDAQDFDGARRALTEAEPALVAAELSPAARRDVERGLTEIGDGLAPDAYWRQRTWRRVLVIFAGPAANALIAIVLFAGVLMVGTGDYRLGFSLEANGTSDTPTGVVASVVSGYPAARIGLHAGDRVVAIDGHGVGPLQIASTIRASHGRPVRLTVDRSGRRVTLPPAAPRKDTGDSVGKAFSSSLNLTWQVTRETGVALGDLVHAKGRRQISSPVGIVRASADAAHQGVRDFLSIMGFLSLSLALLNLLPLLPLDGGHILFSLIEAVRRRAVQRGVYERASAIGIALVVLLLAIGLSNDFGGRPGG
jgi:regulator of sigma E protease